MSIWSKFNPFSWIKEALITDYVGGAIRHGLTAAGAFLVAVGLGRPEHIGDVQSALGVWLTSPEFIGGVMAVLGYGASIVNKKD